MRGLIGKKIGMTRVFDNEGLSVPVTVLDVGPCYVTQVKTIENDGYDAIQVGMKEEKHTNKPLKVSFRSSGLQSEDKFLNLGRFWLNLRKFLVLIILLDRYFMWVFLK